VQSTTRLKRHRPKARPTNRATDQNRVGSTPQATDQTSHRPLERPTETELGQRLIDQRTNSATQKVATQKVATQFLLRKFSIPMQFSCHLDLARFLQGGLGPFVFLFAVHLSTLRERLC